MIFIVPRGEDRLLLGGLVEPDQWATNIDLPTYAPIRDMLRRNTTFLPALTGAHLDDHDPVRVGLRPFRAQNVRLEHDPDIPAIHNYGHGGAGFSLSWGCAEHATQLVEQALPRPTATDMERQRWWQALDQHDETPNLVASTADRR